MTDRSSTTLQTAAAVDSAARLRSAINRISRRLRPTTAGQGFTPTEILVLETVANRGPIRLSDLAAVEAMNPTMLSRVARRLEEAGLIHRHPHPVDGRAALLEITGPGRQLRERIRTERTDQLSVELGALSDQERRLVLDALPVLERLAKRLTERESR
jgi:DNA-binding MarR family transcriptional regulator